MHAPPHFHLTVRHFGVWRGAVTIMVVIVCGVLAGWLVTVPSIGTGWKSALVLLAGAAAVTSLWQAWALQPMSLRWDTQSWHLSVAESEPKAGRLFVQIDLGAWMLLRFVPEESPSWYRRSVWLPVQRRGHAASWQVLRATVYCARPDSLPSVAPF